MTNQDQSTATMPTGWECLHDCESPADIQKELDTLFNAIGEAINSQEWEAALELSNRYRAVQAEAKDYADNAIEEQWNPYPFSIWDELYDVQFAQHEVEGSHARN